MQKEQLFMVFMADRKADCEYPLDCGPDSGRNSTESSGTGSSRCNRKSDQYVRKH